MLGHASAAMTLDIYADLFDDDLEAVATALHDARARENVGKMWARGGNWPASQSTDRWVTSAGMSDDYAANLRI
jgi:hypothetical protein